MFLREENSSLRLKCTELEEAHANLRARCFALDAMSSSTSMSTSPPLPSPSCRSNGSDLVWTNTAAASHHRNYSSSHHHHHHCNHQRRASTAGSTTRTNRTCANRRVAKENQDLITSLYRRNEEIMRDYSVLRNKHQNVLSNNGKLKKEVQSLRLRTSANYRPRTSIFPTSSSFARTGACMRLAKDASNHCPSNKRQTTRAYEHDADESDSLSEALASTNTPSDPPIFATKDPTGIAFPQASSCPDYQSHESLVKELANATSKLHSLKEKYGKLESTCNECLDNLEQTKRALKVTRRANELLEEEVSELRAQNASLEEKVTQLCCDAPIASIRLPVAAAMTSSTTTASSNASASSPSAALRPNDESDEDMDGRASARNKSADFRIIPEEGNDHDEKAAEEAASPTSALMTDMASSKAQGVAAEIDDGVTTSVATLNVASSKAEEDDAQSQSPYHDETFDEYADESFEE